MNKKKIIIISVLILIFIIFCFLLMFYLKITRPYNKKNDLNNKISEDQNNYNINEINNVNKDILNKYKKLEYIISVDNVLACKRDLKCAYDVLSNCMASSFVTMSKTDKVGYIISIDGLDSDDKNACKVRMINGADHKTLNCRIEYKNLDKDFLNTFFENKKYLEYCK